MPEVAALKELVVNNHLGPLRNIEITLLRSTLRRRERTRSRGWWFKRESGGGLAGAMLSHLIDQASWLAGDAAVRTVGLRRTANPERTDGRGSFHSSVDDGAFALIEYGDGLTARLCADATTAVESYTCAVHGEERSAVASGPDLADLTLYAVDREQTDQLECKPSPYRDLARINDNVPLLMELYDEFVKKIEGAPNSLPTFEEALGTQEALAVIGYEL